MGEIILEDRKPIRLPMHRVNEQAAGLESIVSRGAYEAAKRGHFAENQGREHLRNRRIREQFSEG